MWWGMWDDGVYYYDIDSSMYNKKQTRFTSENTNSSNNFNYASAQPTFNTWLGF